MSTKVKVIIVVASLGTAFALGRYTVPTKIKTEIKTVEVIKTITVKDTSADKKVHKETTTTESTKKDGTKETKTIVVEDSDFKKDTTIVKKDDDKKTSDDKSETTKTGSRLNISALAGAPISLSGLGNFTYGLHISRDLIGPVSVGLWGMSDSTFGLSVGLTF